MRSCIIFSFFIMSREAPSLSQNCCRPGNSLCQWTAVAAAAAAAARRRLALEPAPFPCISARLNCAVGIAWWPSRPAPWLAVPVAHWLAFADGKSRRRSRRPGLGFWHLLRKPCCLLHLLFEIPAIPGQSILINIYMLDLCWWETFYYKRRILEPVWKFTLISR